jgi:hypothetical protein
MLAVVTASDRKADLHGCLRAAREAVLWKLEGQFCNPKIRLKNGASICRKSVGG